MMQVLDLLKYYGKRHTYHLMQELIVPKRFSDLVEINDKAINHTYLSATLKSGVELGLIRINKGKYELTEYGFRVFSNVNRLCD